MSWTLTQIRTYMRLHLSGSATPSDDELGRAWIHALGDFSRFIPRERYKIYVLDFDEVTDEAVTLTAHGTVKSLANTPIKWDSERIFDDAAETTKYTRDTDYTIDYLNGTITSISGGAIGATATIFCNYTISKQSLDISGLTDMYRIKNVWYPYGEVPEDAARYRLFAGLLTILGKKSTTTPSQGQLVDGKQVLVEYYGNHTAPDTTTAGSAPEWSNEIILKGCEAYSYLMEAISYDQLAATQMASAVTVLGTTISHTAATAAMAAGSAALVEASAAIDRILTGDDYHALADAALDAANAEIDKVVADTSTGDELYDATQVEDIQPGSEGDFWLNAGGTIDAKAFLTAGQALINAVNKGEDVTLRELEYADRAMAVHDRFRAMGQFHLERASARTQAALAYVQEAMGRIRQVEQIVTEAQTEVATGNGYARVGEAYESDISNLIREAEGFIASGMQYGELADKYRDLGVLRRNEFWMILTDRSQHGTEKTTSSGTQMA